MYRPGHRKALHLTLELHGFELCWIHLCVDIHDFSIFISKFLTFFPQFLPFYFSFISNKLHTYDKNSTKEIVMESNVWLFSFSIYSLEAIFNFLVILIKTLNNMLLPLFFDLFQISSANMCCEKWKVAHIILYPS